MNDQLVIDQWVNQAVTTHSSAPINLTAGQWYDIRLDYYNTQPAGKVTLRWSSPSTNKGSQEPISQDALLPISTYLSLAHLYPIASLVSTFTMKASEVAYLSAHGSDFQGVDPTHASTTVNFYLSLLPSDRSSPDAVDTQAPAFFNQWLALNALFTLRNALPVGNVGLFDIFAAASANPSATMVSSGTAATVHAATGWDTTEFSTLVGHEVSGTITIGFGLTDLDFKNALGTTGKGLVWLKGCLDLGARLGVSTSQLFHWANTWPDASQAQDIKNVVKAKYDETTWVTVGKPLNDLIREHSKEALIAYVLTMPAITDLSITSADELYEYFLIDVQMTSCMLTSRIVQATAAIQLFVQRCLMNLENEHTSIEQNVAPDAIDAGQWAWRQNYRLWQANREIFLYPENWANNPALRDDRTPFFQELQTELQQGQITADSAEQAFQNYLTKLQEVARLEMCGLYFENDSESGSQIFHVFGRTYTSPHVYYYRTFDLITGVWSAWERVDADIEGDHLVPVVWNRRLHLFWPLFKEQTTPTQASGSIPIPPISPQPGSSAPTLPQKSLEIKLAWSEYRNGAWTKKQVSADALTPTGTYSNYTDDFDPSVLSFQAVPNEPGLEITVYYWGPYSETVKIPIEAVAYILYDVGEFVFDGCSGTPTPIAVSQAVIPTAIPENSVFDYMYLDENVGQTQVHVDPNAQGQLVLVTSSDSSNLSPVPVLSSTPSQYQLLYAQQFLPAYVFQAQSPLYAEPFFYADSVRTYFVTGTSVPISRVVSDPNSATLVYNPAQLTTHVTAVDLPDLPIFEAQAIRPVVGGLAQDAPAPPAGRAAAPRARAAISVANEPAVAVATTTPAALTSAATWEVPAPWQAYLSTLTELVFSTHHHPHVCDFLKALNWKGIPGLLTLQNQQLDAGDVEPQTIFAQQYQPTATVWHPYPSEAVDFSPGGAYSIYNWEVFFHIPFLISTLLTENLQYEDAQIWLQYIFNPTSNSTDAIPGRYWNFLPFYQNTDLTSIQDLLKLLDSTDPAAKAQFEYQINQWESHPFDPDVIARLRIVAYQKAVVMKYLDNLIAWGDYLYNQNTRESINHATQLYVLAQQILGDKPVLLPAQGVIPDRTYNDLAINLDDFSDALVSMEDLFPFSTQVVGASGDNASQSSVTSAAQVPYFCTPANDTLLGYWDTVAKRLFQIRHCMNIAGQVEQLPLFAPPINPALLIEAAALGMDVTSALSDITATTPFYRFTYVLQKAGELCAEVRALGSALLSALEKSDAEALSLLRATQETALLKAVRQVKVQQLTEANYNLNALNESLTVMQDRQAYYQGLIKAGLSPYENTQIAQLNQAMLFQTLSQGMELLGSELAGIPNFDVGLTGLGGSPTATASFGGSQLSAAASGTSRAFGMVASLQSSTAAITGIQGGWDRRNQDWTYQLQNANDQIVQINNQISAATARVTIAQTDLDNQDLQIANASDVEDFLRTKYTNQELFDWMASQVSAIYFQAYQIAYDLAKRAEACFVFERLPDPSTYVPYIQFGYWDSLRKGLLSGERLSLDLKRLELAYLDQNQRDYEICKPISLLLLDPMALISLKETGQCIVQFPEALFDMDYPGHYMRRIKSVNLTIPCVTGPYTTVNCTLTLVTNKIRFSNAATQQSDYQNAAYFVTNYAATQSIATSTAQNDSGLFQVNFNDERYLPFEGAGVISTWQLSMPLDTNAFDFDTITDVIFNLKYTARDGGASLRSVARSAATLPPGSTPGATPLTPNTLLTQFNLTRMFSLRHEFPTEWYSFLHPRDTAVDPDQSMTINLTQDRFPFQYRNKSIQIYQVDLVLLFRNLYDPATYSLSKVGTPLGDYPNGPALVLNLTPPGGTANALQLQSNSALLNRVPFGTVPQPPPPPPPPALGSIGAWTLVARGTDIQNIAKSLRTQITSSGVTLYRLNANAIDDMFLVCHFSTTDRGISS